MKAKFLNQADVEYSPRKRLVALIPEGILFLVILPAALVFFSSQLDRRFELPALTLGVINVALGCAFMAAGILLAWWAIYVQFTIGRGTPVPLMATQQLIVQRPYNYCRNPMALGTIVLYLGVALLIGSVWAVILVAVGSVLLLVYIKLLEEKEMRVRFGEAYQEYRKHTPFIIPRLPQKKRGKRFEPIRQIGRAGRGGEGAGIPPGKRCNRAIVPPPALFCR